MLFRPRASAHRGTRTLFVTHITPSALTSLKTPLSLRLDRMVPIILT